MGRGFCIAEVSHKSDMIVVLWNEVVVVVVVLLVVVVMVRDES